jgi:hypothetical protein
VSLNGSCLIRCRGDANPNPPSHEMLTINTYVDVYTRTTPKGNSSPIMSYYFTIIGTKDNPIFEHEFGTSKPGGDGTAKFREEAAHMNQFIVHAALDMVEEVQWGTKDL